MAKLFGLLICSFTFPRVNSLKAGAHLRGNTLKLSKVGEVEVILHRPIPERFEIKQATILSKADGWYCSFALEDKTVPALLPIDEIKTATGIDVGLKKFLTTADGQSIEVPQYYRKAQATLARQQRQLARKVKGSKNHSKQSNKVAKIHLHVARQRKEFHYHVAHWLVKSYDLIVFENLNIRGLARTRLAKSILDVAWGAFLQIMQAVAVRRGKHTTGVDPRGTSINCSSCGNRVEKTLAVRVHSCSCGLVIDRDWNSALNLLKRGSVGLPIPGCGGLDVSQPLKQQVSYVNLRCSRYIACN
ncbi:transposase [Halotia wernerae UHCC 0503]|nr:transposase [Halotia wernerae UHCC 0503]